MTRIKPRIAVNLVGVAALAVATIAWAAIRLFAPMVIDRPFSVTADFAASGGVFTNQEVTYRGVLVGKVGDLELNDDGVDIELLINPDWDQRIPANVIARVQSKSAVGEQFVNLTPTSASERTLREGDRIPRARTRLPVDFQRLLRTLDRVLADVPPDITQRLIRSLGSSIGGRGEEIAVILESLATLSESFASVAPEQQRLLATATKVGRNFLRSKRAFARAIRAADKIFLGIGDEPAELESLFVQNDRLARSGVRFITTQGRSLEEGIDALADFVEYQLSELDTIDASLRYVPAFLHAIEDVSIPWRSPDGREFYRIRAGLIFENVKESWPCKYKTPFEYERFPHEREEREPYTEIECR